MTLRGARVAVDASTTVRRDVAISHGRISFYAPGYEGVDLSGFLLLPGFINAHDHLEFNLFPRLGTRMYSNATEWAEDVYRPETGPVREQLRIPKQTRLMWGGVKNLLSGVTTVAHHNPYHPVFEENFPVRVVKAFDWAHSLAFSPDLVERFRAGSSDRPFVIHAAEGIDPAAADEIVRLNDLGLLTPRTVLVHALALSAADIALVREKGVSIVWCPTSNLSTYGRTLTADLLRSGIPIALGSDSAITADGDLMDEIGAASKCSIEAGRIYEMVTTGAARILRLRNGEGTIVEGGVADLVGVRDEGQSPAEAILGLRPEFVITAGRVKGVRSETREGFSGLDAFHPLHVDGRGDWLVDVKIPSLMTGSQLRVAGRLVLAG